MNTLYGLLISTVPESVRDSYYIKKYYPEQHTDRTLKICTDLMQNIPVEKQMLFIYFICSSVKDTVFGLEITELDSENTYGNFYRDPNATEDDSMQTLWDVTESAEKISKLIKWLDEDIKTRLVLPGWLDVVSAICLQLLREITSKNG